MCIQRVDRNRLAQPFCFSSQTSGETGDILFMARAKTVTVNENPASFDTMHLVNKKLQGIKSGPAFFGQDIKRLSLNVKV